MIKIDYKTALTSEEESKFKDICTRYNLSKDEAYKMFVRSVVERGWIPIEITNPKNILTEDDISTLWTNIENTANNSPEMSIDEINEIIDEVRAEKCHNTTNKKLWILSYFWEP